MVHVNKYMYIYTVNSLYGHKTDFNSNYKKRTISFCIPELILWNKIKIHKKVQGTKDVLSGTFKKVSDWKRRKTF